MVLTKTLAIIALGGSAFSVGLGPLRPVSIHWGTVPIMTMDQNLIAGSDKVQPVTPSTYLSATPTRLTPQLGVNLNTDQDTAQSGPKDPQSQSLRRLDGSVTITLKNDFKIRFKI